MEYDVETVKGSKLKFDDIVKGIYYKVEYTHDIQEDRVRNLPIDSPYRNYVINLKMFICYDESGRALPLYQIGLTSAKRWINDMDYKKLRKDNID